jgi:hypothetical protein
MGYDQSGFLKDRREISLIPFVFFVDNHTVTITRRRPLARPLLS